MEEDYFPINKEEQAELESLGISYRWQDSCLQHLKDYRRCQNEHFFTHRFSCMKQKNLWQTCEVERERKICGTENLAPVSKEES